MPYRALGVDILLPCCLGPPHAPSQCPFLPPCPSCCLLLLLLLSHPTAAQERNAVKAGLLYDTISASNGFYFSPVEESVRSKMNVPFTIPSSPDLEKAFIAGGRGGEGGLSWVVSMALSGGCGPDLGLDAHDFCAGSWMRWLSCCQAWCLPGMQVCTCPVFNAGRTLLQQPCMVVPAVPAHPCRCNLVPQVPCGWLWGHNRI